ncbi:hypothetical protein STSP2_00111 [Anaerohalosphaera lusitana]|uniref:Ice-binding protein C-terminal domain-containing protein n=1 Tax=Anaerohalosphaera lusitana TaxID=1936003 RepID=A0A1U9NGB9_9BACT|nr:PEP-CTERM sorting domain-containing protein [Anaerohalosphaera lusitana]AQT66973.1 hypothetical protein STSP2_00111 [Anaerohalosphaera lusitana]
MRINILLSVMALLAFAGTAAAGPYFDLGPQKADVSLSLDEVPPVAEPLPRADEYVFVPRMAEDPNTTGAVNENSQSTSDTTQTVADLSVPESLFQEFDDADATGEATAGGSNLVPSTGFYPGRGISPASGGTPIYFGGDDDDPFYPVIPEPATIALLGIGMLGMSATRKCKVR